MARRIQPRRDDQKEFLSLFMQLCQTRNRWEVWSDFVLCSAVAISNALDQSGNTHDAREQEYLTAIKRYDKDEQEVLSKLFAEVILALERNPKQDFLGEVFTALELSNHWAGQFFTPYHICEFMAEVTLNGIESAVEERGWIGVNDPCCGAGALLIAARNVMVRKGLPYTTMLYAAQDIDRTAALMCYIQLSLLGCAGYVVVADSLIHPLAGPSLQPHVTPEQEIWYMPMLCTDVWQGRILWQHLSALLTANTKSAEVRPADTTALPTPPPIKAPVDSEMPVPLPVIVPEYAATSTGQLTLF